MATPHVAAVMALMRAVHPGLTQQAFLDLLAAGTITEDLGTAGRDDEFGHGLIDARKAVVAAAELAGGTPPAADPVLASSRSALQFGASLTSLFFDLRNGGSGTLENVAPTDDAAWLTLVQDSVRADGTGRYQAVVARTGLADGLHTATITVTSSANTLQIPVTVQVSTATGGASAGYTYVLLVDAATLETVDQAEGVAGAAGLAYAFTGVAAGSYAIVAGSDQNNDGLICDVGESCGAYPTLDAFEALDVGADRVGLDFLSGFSFGTNTAAQVQDREDDKQVAAPGGWRRLR